MTARNGGWLGMMVGALMWARTNGEGNDIVSAVGTSCMYCNCNWQWGWWHNGAVVHQWVHHRHNNGNAVVISCSVGSPSVCACCWGWGGWTPLCMPYKAAMMMVLSLLSSST